MPTLHNWKMNYENVCSMLPIPLKLSQFPIISFNFKDIGTIVGMSVTMYQKPSYVGRRSRTYS